MQEIAVLRWCDKCTEIDAHKREATSYRMAFPGTGLLEIELCQEHAEELFFPLKALVDAYAHPVPSKAKVKVERSGKTPSNARRFLAPGERAVSATEPAPQTMANNVAGARRGKPTDKPRIHHCLVHPDMTYAGRSGQARHYEIMHHGILPGQVYGSTCPLDGEPFTSLLSMSRHLGLAHNLESVSQVFAEAEALGDPFGAVTAARRRLASVDEATVAAPAAEAA